MTVALTFCALLVGLALGLLGAGGGIITVPSLIFGGGFEPNVAMAHSLMIVGVIAIFSASREYRLGNVHPRPALIYLLASTSGSFLASRYLSQVVSSKTQLLLFCGFLVTASAAMVYNVFRIEPVAPTKSHSPMKYVGLGLAGLAVGGLSGLLGASGGFLMVPSLIFFLGFPMNHAVGTSLAIMCMNATVGVIGYLPTIDFNLPVVGMFAGCGILGSTLGMGVRQKLPVKALKIIFAITILCITAYTIWAKFLNQP